MPCMNVSSIFNLHIPELDVILHQLVYNLENTYGVPSEVEAAFATYHTSEGRRTCRVLGVIHSVNDEPAIIHGDDTREWYRNGSRHRDNDKPAVEWECDFGILHRYLWYDTGIRHRINGPAVDSYADLKWYRCGVECNPDGSRLA